MSKHYEVPVGGCIKKTEGTFTQVFDKDGNMIDSGFYAVESDYLDEHDNDIEDDRINFYHPFDTAPTKTLETLEDLLDYVKGEPVHDIGIVMKDAKDIIKHLEG